MPQKPPQYDFSDFDDAPASPQAKQYDFSDFDNPRPKTPIVESALRGGVQGVSLGFADELVGAAEGSYDFATDPNAQGLSGWKASYDKARDESRAAFDKAYDDHPYAYGGGALAGGAATMAIPGLNVAKLATVPARLASGAASGGIASAGSSRADPTESPAKLGEFLSDTGEGAVLGFGLQGGMEALGAAASSELAGKGAKKLLSTLGGVKEKFISRYLDDPAAIRGAKELGEVKDLADTHIAGVDHAVDEARRAEAAAQQALGRADENATAVFQTTREKIKGKMSEANERLARAYHAKIEELTGKKVPMELAREVVQRLENESAALGAMSTQADDALARSGKTYRKADLLEHADAVGSEPGRAAIGEGRVDALGRFKGYRDRIEGAYGDELSGEQLRDMMRQVRDDTNFTGPAGQRSPDLDKLRKGFTERVSDVLKTDVVDGVPQVSEYGKIMGEMRPRSRVLEEMSEHFGKEHKALASLETLASDKGARGTYLRDLVSRYEEATGQTGILGKLQETIEARRVLSSPTAKDALRSSLPEARQVGRAQKALEQFDPKRTRAATDLMIEASPIKGELAAARDQVADALQSREVFKGWSPQTSEGRLKSVMAGRSIENQKTIEHLSRQTGLDFGKMLEDRAVADAFEKGFMHGSRNVNLWSMVSKLFGSGGAFGHVVGPVVGAAIDTGGGKMTRGLLDAFMALRDSKYLPALESAAKRGPQALQTTHFLLQKQDPEYRARFGQREP